MLMLPKQLLVHQLSVDRQLVVLALVLREHKWDTNPLRNHRL